MSDGYKSRKLWLTFVALGMIAYGFKMSGAPRDLYGTYCMAVLGACGLYKAANILEKRNPEAKTNA